MKPTSPATELIDLIEAGRTFRGRIGFRFFGHELVTMIDELVSPYAPAAELAGVERCALHFLRRLRWRGRIGFLPSPFWTEYGQRGIWPTPHDVLIARSLMRTAQHYRQGLNESVSGLRRILLADFVQGLEWACDAACRGLDLTQHDEIPRLPENAS